MALKDDEVQPIIESLKFLGLVLSIPSWNFYLHGTYMTAAHAHLALFGAVGMSSMAEVTYVLPAKTKRITRWDGLRAWTGLGFVNAGPALMSVTLIAAGLLQTYLWRVLGMSFMESHELLRPYLAVRAVGGAVYAAGAILYVWVILALVRRTGFR